MPYDLTFDVARRHALLQANGPVTFDAGLEAIIALAQDARLGAGHAIVVDLRQADYSPSLADLQKLGALDGEVKHLHGHPVAFVTASQVHYMAASLLATLAGQKGATMRAFKDWDDALVWLDATRG